jgi:hypothetical protein
MEWLTAPNWGRLGADLVVLTHACWVVFLLAGIFLAGSRLWLRPVHLAGLLLNATMDLTGQACPLTLLEQSLRRAYDPAGWYAGSSLQHYLGSLVGVSVSTEAMRWLGICLLVGAWLAYQTDGGVAPGHRRTSNESGQ